MLRLPVFIAPTLALLACGADLSAATATPEERDANFEAVWSLIDREFRLPALRQIDEYKKAGYPDEGHAKLLEWAYADRFQSATGLDKAATDALAAQAKKLKSELEAARLPEALKQRISGGGDTLRLVNRILSVINPDLPPPLGGVESIPAEKRAELQRVVDQLAQSSNAAFKAALDGVKAHAKDEEAVWDKDEKDPNYQRVMMAAVMKRLEAVKAVYTPWLALSEVASRGKDFGLDPAPAQAWIAALVKEHGATFQNWDFQFGDMHVFLRAYCLALTSEAARLKVKGFTPDDVQGDITKALDVSLKEFGSKQQQDEVQYVLLKLWGYTLKWRLNSGGDRNLAAGVELWNDYLERARKTPGMQLTAPAPRGLEVARLHFIAARLFAARGDAVNATKTASAVANVKPAHAMAGNAKAWVAYLNNQGGGSSGGGWGASPSADNPAESLGTAKAFLGSANETADKAQQRKFYTNAVVSLRNGILGLASPNYAETFVDTAPELYNRYIIALLKLEMRWQAAVAAEAGLRALSLRIDPKSNPWRDARGQWTESGKQVGSLAKNAITAASGLYSRASGTGVGGLYKDIIELVNKVAPEEGGKGLSRNQIIFAIQEGSFDEALKLCDEHLRKYAEDDAWVATQRVSLLMSKVERLQKTDKKAADTAAAQLLKVGEELKAGLPDKIAKAKAEKNGARVMELMRASTTAESSGLFILIQQEKFEEVLDKLGADYWKNPPDDLDLSLRMLGNTCRAALRHHQTLTKDDQRKLDPKALLDAWPKYQAALAALRSQRQRITDPDMQLRLIGYGKTLASLFNRLQAHAAQLNQMVKDAPPALAQVAEESKRAFADLMDPVVDKTSPADLVLNVAESLWSLDEHKRAARLYEIYRQILGASPELAAIKQDPKSVLDKIGELASQRPELRADWKLVRDLIEDGPDTIKLRKDGVTDSAKYGPDQPRNYPKAVVDLRKFRAKVDGLKITLGGGYAALNDGLGALEKQVLQLAQEIRVWENLAFAYREMGEKAKANEIYELLLGYDPADPDTQAAVVDIVIDRIKAGEKMGKDELSTNRDRAANVRNLAANGSETWWTAAIQVLELSAAMGDRDTINNTLAYYRVDKTTPANDLQVLPRNVWDDRRTKRPRSALAVTIAKRFLDLFQQGGVVEKPTFRIDEVEVDGKKQALFVTADGPKFVAQKRTGDGGVEFVHFWEEGKPPPDADDAPPAAGTALAITRSATAATAAAPAPTPAPVPAATPAAAATPAKPE